MAAMLTRGCLFRNYIAFLMPIVPHTSHFTPLTTLNRIFLNKKYQSKPSTSPQLAFLKYLFIRIFMREQWRNIIPVLNAKNPLDSAIIGVQC